jgi:hypothetical protein
MSNDDLNELKKLRKISTGTIKQITSLPKKEPQEEKLSKTLRIKNITHKKIVEMYGEKIGSQGEVVDKGVAILYALWKILPEEKFHRIVKLAEEDRFEELANRLGIEIKKE